jgi:hypothetical protein
MRPGHPRPPTQSFERSIHVWLGKDRDLPAVARDAEQVQPGDHEDIVPPCTVVEDVDKRALEDGAVSHVGGVEITGPNPDKGEPRCRRRSTAKLAIHPGLLYLGPPGGEVFDAQDLRVDDCPVTNGRVDQLIAFRPKQLEQLAQSADEQDRRITWFWGSHPTSATVS